MTEGEKIRLVAWSDELRAVHERLREALRVVRASLDDGGNAGPAGHDLLLFCRGFCTALTGHHEGEERELFPAIAAEHPDLHEILRYLEQDHVMIAHLVAGMQAASERAASQDEMRRHLEGIAAIMESHFRYEERELRIVLESVALTAEPSDVLGPL